MNSEQELGLKRALVDGDLSVLDAEQRQAYYEALCESVGLNPLTRPLEYLELGGRLVLYAKRDATDQLRHKHKVSIEILDRTLESDTYTVRARATLPDGRTDESLGAVTLSHLAGEARANALMTGETKAKRRVTLSICGLGLLDETEVATVEASIKVEKWPTRSTAALRPAAVFEAWDAQGHATRQRLYDYATTTFNKRITALRPEDLQVVLTWIAAQAESPTPEEAQHDAA